MGAGVAGSPFGAVAAASVGFPLASLPPVTVATVQTTDRNTNQLQSNFAQALKLFRTAIQNALAAFSPSGVILAYGGAVANPPSGYLACDGTKYLASQYPSLFSAIGYSYGGSGAYFNVPDLRGRFLRGTDNMGTAAGAAGNDPDTSSRTAMAAGGSVGDKVGSVQGQATRKNGLALTDPGHSHASTNANMQFNVGTQNWASGSSFKVNTGATGTSSDSSGVSLGSGDNETRPLNAYVNYIIKT